MNKQEKLAALPKSPVIKKKEVHFYSPSSKLQASFPSYKEIKDSNIFLRFFL